MTGRRAAVPALLLAALLGGCGGRTGVLDARAVTLPQPQLAESLVQHEVAFEGPGGSIGPGERAALRAFLESYQVGPTARITVAADGSGADARRHALVALLRGWGYAASGGGGSGGYGGTGEALVLVRQTVMTEPAGCRASDIRNAAFEPYEVPINRFGCATAHNLGAMIHDPNDLVAGDRMGPADGERAASMVRSWLVLPSALASTPPTESVSTTSGE
jgi:pilus assembly protein CpaD